jgi:ribosomal protein S18
MNAFQTGFLDGYQSLAKHAAEEETGFDAPAEFEDAGFGMRKLKKPLTYTSLAGDQIIIPAGFTTDLYTIPKKMKAVAGKVLPDVLQYKEPSILHDYLFSTGRIGDRRIKQAEADHLLREAIERKKNISELQARLTYGSVRVGAFPAWYGHRILDKFRQVA